MTPAEEPDVNLKQFQVLLPPNPINKYIKLFKNKIDKISVYIKVGIIIMLIKLKEIINMEGKKEIL